MEATFRMAWRNIWRNPRRTLIILIATIVGVWGMLMAAAFSFGIKEQMIRDSIQNLTGHIQIHARGFHQDPVIQNSMDDPSPALEALRSVPSIRAFARRVRVPGMVMDARNSAGITIVGIDPPAEARASFIGRAVRKGIYLRPGDIHKIIIGKKLADKFDTGIGKKLVLMAQDAEGEIGSAAFQIQGIYKAPYASQEEKYVFITLEAAQNMLGLGERLSEVAIIAHDRDDVPGIHSTLRNSLTDDFEVLDWKTLLPLIVSIIKMYDVFLALWFAAIFIALSFGIINALLMAIFERVREFGIMKAMGMRPVRIVLLVLVESLWLSIIGIAMGNLVGWLTLMPLANGLDLSRFAEGADYFGMAHVIYPSMSPGVLLWSDMTVLMLGVIAGLYPAIRAGRFRPAEALSRI